MTMKTMVLPNFSGFYNSYHDYAIDNEIDSFCMNQESEINEKLKDYIFMQCDFRELHCKYSETFVKHLSIELDIKMTFQNLISPKYYNFETDRIAVEITEKDYKKIIRKTDKNILIESAKTYFKSRDGFISFYDYDIEAWNFKNLDCNQLMCVFSAYLKTIEFDHEYFEYKFIEDISGNGRIYKWIDKFTDFTNFDETD